MRLTHGYALLLFVGIVAGGYLLGSPGISGEVTDGATPVAGARIRYQGERTATVTDHHGRFRLPAGSGRPRRVTAWKQGYSIAATSANGRDLHLSLTPLPTVDSDAYAWVDPAPNSAQPNNCGNCHGEIYREWAGSAHANSATNRRFLNLFAGTDWHGRRVGGWSLWDQKREGAGVCAACHAPTFRDPAFTYDFRAVKGVARRGVHCDYCHKVADAPTDRLGLRFGRDGLTLLRPADGQQLFFGPLDDAHREGESFAYSPLYKESRYCASCHEGVVFGVHVYGTYSEWLDSPARRQGRQCQDCHMTPTGRLTNVAPAKGGIERDPRTLAGHRFPGGQRDRLRRCLKVTAVPERTAIGLRVAVEVRADNVGHRVPTGFIDRNLVLVVMGLDRDGRTLPLRDGPRLPASAGRGFAGLPGRLYAKELTDGDGRLRPFWLAEGEPQDTRLFPGRPERSVFVFPPETARVRVRLLYRRFWQDVADERAWPDNEVVVMDTVVAG